MVAEEIEIVVTARVEEALRGFKRILPEIKRQMGQVQQEFSKVDLKSIANKTQNGVQQVKQKIGELKGSNTDKALQQQFEKASSSVVNYRQQLEQTKEELRQVYAQMDMKQEKTWKQYTPDGLELGNKGIEPTVNQALGKDKEYQNLIAQETKLNQKVEELNQKLQQAKQNYKNIGAEVEQTHAKQNIFTVMAEKTNSIFKTTKSQIGSTKNSFNGLPNITAKVTANIKQMSAGMKQGLAHILKYAGSLFSLRGIYSVLSSSASSWLSGQNAGAKQLATNIEYMKNTMGSALAPIIQWLTGLVYNLMKAIQSVVYALFRVNIFAKASAKSYGSMAGSAKKAKSETKQLAGVHDEINNIQSNDNADSGGSGSGTGGPSFDLSNVDPSSSIMDAIANGDWYGVGALVAEKLNQAMTSIPWDSIQNTARQIGTNIANFLNGFIATTKWEDVGRTIAQGLNTAIMFVESFITTFNWQNLGTAITLKWQDIVDGIVNLVKGLNFEGISDALFEMLGSAAGSLVNLGMIIGDYIGQALDNAKEFFQERIEECGGSIPAGICLGILDALIGIGDWVREHIFQPFINGFKDVFGIHSPSTVMAEMGKYIIEGLRDGIVSLVDKIKEVWSNMKETAVTKFTEIKDKVVEKISILKEKATELWENIKTVIKEKIDNVKTNLSNTLNSIKTKWDDIWRKFEEKSY